MQATMFDGFPAELFAFYRGLAGDNSKEYWSIHRDTYDGPIRSSLRALAAELEPEYGPAKIYRPNRDVRFGADRSPYKLHTGLYCEVAPDIFCYVNLDGDGMLTGAGLHTQSRPRVAAYRAAVDAPRSGEALAAIVADLSDRGFRIEGEQVRTRPRGVPADHPRLDLMRRESLNARRLHPVAKRLGTRAALDTIRADWQTLRPLNDWLAEHAGQPA
jgi:uncharacterized protein (TIGR02453 family)